MFYNPPPATFFSVQHHFYRYRPRLSARIVQMRPPVP